ncbi:MAG: hypothetical protein L0206_09885 [Actinobacteria bacterium]|nr:hypothetical protein [Actinomycetota bacterium]
MPRAEALDRSGTIGRAFDASPERERVVLFRCEQVGSVRRASSADDLIANGARRA